MEKVALEKYVYTVGITISNIFIGYVENSDGSPQYVKEVNEALTFETKSKAYAFEDKIRNSIGIQKHTFVETFQVLKQETKTETFHYSIIGVV